MTQLRGLIFIIAGLIILIFTVSGTMNIGFQHSAGKLILGGIAALIAGVLYMSK